MTRKEQISDWLSFILRNGVTPTGLNRNMLDVYCDSKAGIHFKLGRYDKWIASITADREMIIVRKDTVYKLLFETFAEESGWKLKLIDEITAPATYNVWQEYSMSQLRSFERPQNSSVSIPRNFSEVQQEISNIISGGIPF